MQGDALKESDTAKEDERKEKGKGMAAGAKSTKRMGTCKRFAS